MNRNLHIVFAALFAAMLSACGATVSNDCTCGYYVTNGQEMHWPDASTLSLGLHSSVPAIYQPAIVSAAKEYNLILATTTLNVGSGSTPVPDYVSGDGVNGIYFHDEPWPWEAQAPGSVAITTLQFSDSGISEADIHFRSSAFLTSDPASTEWIYVVALHEMGHMLGRVHSSDTSSLMFPDVSLDHVVHPFSNADLSFFQQFYQLTTLAGLSPVN